MADVEAVDYVIVHELAHIEHHDHSANFWGTIERTLPDYKQRAEKLKQIQRRLSHEEWD